MREIELTKINQAAEYAGLNLGDIYSVVRQDDRGVGSCWVVGPGGHRVLILPGEYRESVQ